MKKKYIILLITAVFILIVPTAIYLGILIPKMKEEYIILMSSGGIIGGAGFYGASVIPEKTKYSSLYKLSANSFTILTIITLVQEFIMQIIGLVATFIVSFIIFLILKEYANGARRKQESSDFANEIARNIIENTK